MIQGYIYYDLEEARGTKRDTKKILLSTFKLVFFPLPLKLFLRE